MTLGLHKPAACTNSASLIPAASKRYPCLCTQSLSSLQIAMAIASDHILLLLFLLLSLKACLSFPYSVGDGCSDYRIEHSVSATLDSDVDRVRNTIGDPLAVPEAFFFYLFDQQFWVSEEILNMENAHIVLFKSGGYANLQLCSFQGDYGVLVEILETTEFDVEDNLKGAKIALKFLPESWYANRAVLHAGFSLDPNQNDMEHAQNVMWSFVDSVIHHAQATFGAYPCDYEFRSSSGYCNNVGRHVWGAINQPMRRLRFKDPDPRWEPVDEFGAPIDESRPSAREVSNVLLDQTANVPTASGVNMLWVTFGQFIDHDITLTPAHGENSPAHESFNIMVSPDDAIFHNNANEANCKVENMASDSTETDEAVTKEEEYGLDTCAYSHISFFRSDQYSYEGKPTEPRTQYNSQTPYLDLSQVYGNSAAKIKFLRSFEGGQLKTGEGDTLPYNGKDGVGLTVAVEAENDQVHGVAGDVRVNEQPYLTALHILWLREHNLLASELHAQFPKWNDERLFQVARQLAIAEYQAIVYNEWLPFLLGPDSVGLYNGYQQCENPTIDVFFATCAFRFGHSMVAGNIKASDAELRDVLDLPIEKTLFQTKLWEEPNVNLDTLFFGAYKQIAEENDGMIEGALRNHLFTDFQKGKAVGFDLAAANIQRCRDHACPSWSDARLSYHKDIPYSWEGLEEFLEDPKAVEKIYNLYGDKNLHNLDPFPVGLLEKKEHGSLVGPLFHKSIKDQFWRLREGDRFFYMSMNVQCDLERYPRMSDIWQGRVTMKDIFLRNFNGRYDESLVKTASTTLKHNVFLSPEHSKCHPPLLILQAQPHDKSEIDCPRPFKIVERYFWDYEANEPTKFFICDIEFNFINNLRGFDSYESAKEHCGSSIA